MSSRRSPTGRQPRARRADPQPSLPETVEHQRRVWIYAALIVLASVVVYTNSVHAPFIFDDRGAVVDNTTIRQLWPPGEALSPPGGGLPVSGRPLVNFSFAVNYAAGGLDVRGFHLFNIALHACCALLLFGIVRRTLMTPALAGRFAWNAASGVAVACALIWTLHPLQTEAVDYVSKRTELLAGVAYLFALYASIRATTSARSVRWLALSVLSCLLGMACKESMVTAPVIILLYDATFVSGSFANALARRGMFYALLAGTWIVLIALIWTGPRGVTAGFTGALTAWTYLLNQSQMIARYLSLAFWPRSLVLDYGEPVPTTLGAMAPYAALVVGVLVVTIAALIRKPAWGFLGAWFFVVLAPTSSIVPIATEVGAESRMYLPLAAIVCAIVVGGYLVAGRARQLTLAAAAVVGLACAGLGAATLHRNAEYRSPVALWRASVERWPNAQAHRNFADALREAGARDEVVAELREAIRDQPSARFALGQVLAEQGRTGEAADELRRALAENPNDPDAPAARDLLARTQGSLANALFAQSRYEEASAAYAEALKTAPDNAATWQVFGVAQFRSGHREDGAKALRRAVNLDPGNGRAQTNLASMLLELHDLDGAIEHAEAGVRLIPTDASAQTMAGVALMRAARFDEAISHLRRAVEIQPSKNDARTYLAEALAAKKVTDRHGNPH